MKPKDYHYCATCKNFLIKRENGKVVSMCERLGYETKSNYKFNCWDPREDIQKRIQEQNKHLDEL